MWELRDWWCFSGEKCQFIEQLLMWVGGSIKQNDISAAASASDDRHLIIIVCLLQKCAYTSLYIYFEGLKLLIFLKNTQRRGEQRKKESSVKIASGSRWKRDHDYYLHLKGKKHETSICYLDWLFIGDFRHSETMLGRTQRMYNQCNHALTTKITYFFLHAKIFAYVVLK